MIKINGVTLPTPSTMKPLVMDISEGERNADGYMLLERIATKQKMELSWKFLTPANLSIVLKAVSGLSFKATYLDPVENKEVTREMYVGDRAAPILSAFGNEYRYNDVSFNIIER